jgi:hypothetical protein
VIRDSGRIVDIKKYVATLCYALQRMGPLEIGGLVNSVSDMTELIRAGANSLLRQHGHSNGYLSKGDSEIAESNLVVHVACSFIA